MAEDIFVFGSNEQGIHGAGSAKYAYEQRGAIWGQGSGMQGQSYGIPTKVSPRLNLSLDKIESYVGSFVRYAKLHPDDTFHVVAIGCGLAGFKPAQIAPMFVGASDNVIMPEEFRPYLKREWTKK